FSARLRPIVFSGLGAFAGASPVFGPALSDSGGRPSGFFGGLSRCHTEVHGSSSDGQPDSIGSGESSTLGRGFSRTEGAGLLFPRPPDITRPGDSSTVFGIWASSRGGAGISARS